MPSRDISDTVSIAELQTTLFEERQDTTLYCRVTAYDQDNNYYTLLLEKPLSILPTQKNQREEDLKALAINTGGSVIDTRTEDNVFNTSTFDVVLDRLVIDKAGALTQEHNVALLFDVSGSMSGNYRDGSVDRALQEMVFPQILEQAIRGKITLHLYCYGSNHVLSLGQYSFELFDESSRKSALAKMKKIKINDLTSVHHLDRETLWHAMDSLVTAQDIFGKNDKKAIYALTDFEIGSKENESGPTLNRFSLEQKLRQKRIAFHPVIF